MRCHLSGRYLLLGSARIARQTAFLKSVRHITRDHTPIAIPSHLLVEVALSFLTVLLLVRRLLGYLGLDALLVILILAIGAVLNRR